MLRAKFTVLVTLFGLLSLLLNGCSTFMDGENEKVIEPWIGTGKTAILVDSAHQWEARPDFVLDDYEFRYCHSQSTSRLLQNVVARDFKYQQFREGTIDYATLKRYDVLFFNIPTRIPGGRSKPDRKMGKLTEDEIRDITRFVKEGGGLLVVSEHNNAYDHAEVLNPLLKHFGVRVPPAYALDKPLSRHTIGTKRYMIRISHYKEHPITRGVRETSWSGGGPLETEHGVAFLSKYGHADVGDYISHKPMRHPNYKVEPGEATGPNIPLVAAVEYGNGRVVVVGDHNVFGVQWLGIGDNFRFAMNIFAWLSKRENEEPHIADLPPGGVKLGFDLAHTNWNPGLRDRRGFHPAFINFSRDPRVFTMGLLDLDDPADVLVLADPEKPYSKRDTDIIDKRLSAKQRVVLLIDPDEPQKGTVQLMKHLVPELEIHTPTGTFTLDQLIPGKRKFQKVTGAALSIASSILMLPPDLKGSALKPRQYRGRGKYKAPRKLEKALPYLLDISVDQGEPFIHATTRNGRKITVARRFAVGGGELVLFLQSKMWSNETFGTMRDEPIHDAAYGAYDLQLAFTKWLAESPPVLEPSGTRTRAESPEPNSSL